MSLDIMFLTNDNLRRVRKEPQVLGLRYRGLSNGVENDQNTANIPGELTTHKRLSTGSTASNQSFDSSHEYAHKHQYVPHRAEADGDKAYSQPKTTNPLFGVNAASHYAPQPVLREEDLGHYDRPNVPNGIRKAPEGQDHDALKNEDATDGRKDLVVNPNQIALTEGGTATYTTDNNGKINVHVTVMINAGTLADLKKQRSQIRTNGSPVENSLASTNNHSITSLAEGASGPEMPAQLNPLALSPSAGAVPRFSGHTSDVVGDTRSRRCCIIM